MKKFKILTICIVILIVCCVFAQPPIQPILNFFLDLEDTPSDYTGEDGKVVKVDEANKKLIFETESGAVEDDAYGAGWNGDTANAPSQNATYDILHQYDTDDDGDIDNIDGAVGGGDITGVGPGALAAGDALTDGYVTTGTVLMIWEGTTDDGNEFRIIVPEDPGSDIDITMPTATGTLAASTDNLGFFGGTTSAELLDEMSDETGTGLLVFGTSPIFTTYISTPKIITAANGDLTLLPNGSGTTILGDAGATSHTLNTNDDLFVSGRLEIDGFTFFDGVSQYADNVPARFGTGNDSDLDWSTTQATANTLVWGMGNTAKSIIFCDNGDVAKDFDHAGQTNPTIFVHSATSPDTANNQWISISHNQTNGVIDVGVGVLDIPDGVTSAGTLEGATITEGGNAVWNATETEIIDSDHYIDGSIDLVHIAAAAYAKDIVATSPVLVDGGTNTDNVLVGADGDVTISVTIAKDIVTTSPLTVNAGANLDNVIIGTDADITIAIADADDDGTTKGAASFDNTDFDAVAGNITIVDDGHAHTGASLSGIDISADTNLAVGTGLTLTDDTLTATEEDIEDFVGGMLGGTETDIAVTYQDVTNDIDFVVTSLVDIVTTSPLTVNAGANLDDVIVGSDADITFAVTVAKDIVTTAPLTGAVDNVIIGTDADITLGIDVLKDLVTTAPVTGGTNDIFPGDDADITVALDFTAAWNFGGAASLELPNGTDPDVAVIGQVHVDTDGGNEPNSVTLRTFMGTDDQAVFADTLKHYCFSVAEPDNLAQADFHPVWKNKTGFSFIITYICGESDIDDFDFTLKERDADGANVTTIEAVQLTTDGTAMYYGSVAFADIDHTTIEAGHTIGYDNSADDATYVLVGFGGYYNADVD